MDTLLSSQFLSKERELINTKISEMETEEKQLQTAISKLETIIHQAKEELLSITEIKKLFVTYRAEYPFSDRQTQRIHLTKLIERIDCKKDALEIKFNLIPDTEYFSLET